MSASEFRKGDLETGVHIRWITLLPHTAQRRVRKERVNTYALIAIYVCFNQRE